MVRENKEVSDNSNNGKRSFSKMPGKVREKVHTTTVANLRVWGLVGGGGGRSGDGQGQDPQIRRRPRRGAGNQPHAFRRANLWGRLYGCRVWVDGAVDPG